jgi:hypothetical protein
MACTEVVDTGADRPAGGARPRRHGQTDGHGKISRVTTGAARSGHVIVKADAVGWSGGVGYVVTFHVPPSWALRLAPAMSACGCSGHLAGPPDMLSCVHARHGHGGPSGFWRGCRPADGRSVHRIQLLPAALRLASGEWLPMAIPIRPASALAGLPRWSSQMFRFRSVPASQSQAFMHGGSDDNCHKLGQR